MFDMLKKWANCDGNMKFANFTSPKSYSRIALQVARKIARLHNVTGSSVAKSAQVTILGVWNADAVDICKSTCFGVVTRAKMMSISCLGL